MSKFKFGERVVCKQDGNIYTVDGFHACPKCGKPTLYLKEKDYLCNSSCGTSNGLMGCQFRELGVRANYTEVIFERLISLGETTEYRLKVSIPELIEIKTPQLT